MEMLDEIMRAESDGEKLLEKAREESDRLVRQAQEDAQELIESVKEECRHNEARIVAEAESAAYERSQEAWKENQKAIETLRAYAEKKLERAVNLIIDSVAGIT